MLIWGPLAIFAGELSLVPSSRWAIQIGQLRDGEDSTLVQAENLFLRQAGNEAEIVALDRLSPAVLAKGADVAMRVQQETGFGRVIENCLEVHQRAPYVSTELVKLNSRRSEGRAVNDASEGGNCVAVLAEESSRKGKQ